jgi:hypothetical protein
VDTSRTAQRRESRHWPRNEAAGLRRSGKAELSPAIQDPHPQRIDIAIQNSLDVVNSQFSMVSAKLLLRFSNMSSP